MPEGVDGNEQDLLPAFGLLTTPCYWCRQCGVETMSVLLLLVVVQCQALTVLLLLSAMAVCLPGPLTVWWWCLQPFPYLHLVHWLVLLWCLSLPLALLRPLGWGSSVISPLIGKHHGITLESPLEHNLHLVLVRGLLADVCSPACFPCRYWG